jgi:hypothetical protein
MCRLRLDLWSYGVLARPYRDEFGTATALGRFSWGGVVNA